MIKKWWHDKVAYQIYPKSFLDTNGDGIGDLRGIISKLDYLKKLGIDIIWLSPIYKSPFVDQGYDISDYYAIAEEFGTMEEFDELLSEAKKRDMYIIMDLVINHCSDQHEWFQKALADPDGEYADYFYFRKGRNGNPPSNLRSYFGGSCWEPVPGTDKYYLHMFAKEQPDLNWENPLLREKLYEMINWWLEKGLAGFRIDAIINIKKDLDFPDFKPDGPDGLAGCWKMVDEVDGVGELLEDLKKHTFQKYEAFTVGEVFNMKEGELDAFIGENGHFSTIFDFSAHILSDGEHGWYDAPPVDFKEWRKAITDSQLRVHGFCEMGPLVRIEPYNYLYLKVKLEDCEEIFEKTILRGEPVERLMYHDDHKVYETQEEIPFYAEQTRLVLKNCGHIDAEHIEEAIAAGSYESFEKAVF